MKTTAAQQSTPPHAPKGQDSGPSMNLAAAATNLAWQLAVVVIVPIAGGYKLDSLLSSAPICTVIGFALAMIAMVLVVWRQAKFLSPEADNKKDIQ